MTCHDGACGTFLFRHSNGSTLERSETRLMGTSSVRVLVVDDHKAVSAMGLFDAEDKTPTATSSEKHQTDWKRFRKPKNCARMSLCSTSGFRR